MHLQHLSKHKTNYILLTGEHQPTLMELRWMNTIPFTISMLLLLRQNVTIVQLICIIQTCLFFPSIFNVAYQRLIFESFRIVFWRPRMSKNSKCDLHLNKYSIWSVCFLIDKLYLHVHSVISKTTCSLKSLHMQFEKSIWLANV